MYYKFIEIHALSIKRKHFSELLMKPGFIKLSKSGRYFIKNKEIHLNNFTSNFTPEFKPIAQHWF